jgi:hypothetical protein
MPEEQEEDTERKNKERTQKQIVTARKEVIRKR